MAAVPWARHYTVFTRAFEDVVVHDAVRSDKASAARRHGSTWRAVDGMCTRLLAEAMDRVDLLEGLIAVAIDEVKSKKGQRYLTVVSDPFTGKVVWVTEGRSKATVNAFFDALGPERAAGLEIVTTDGADWIRTVVAARAPNAEICLETFHAMSWATKALDEVRRDLWRRLKGKAAAWIEHRNLRPRTRELYEGQLRLDVLPVLGEARIARLEPRHVREWHAELSASGLSDVTVAKVYRLLRSILARHIDLHAGTVRVEHALQEATGRGPVLVEPKTAGSRRTVAIPRYLIEVLAEHMDRHVGSRPEALLFTNGRGEPVRRSVWDPAWDEARRAAGQYDLRLHDLRHLAGTLNAQAGATLKETMAWLGHSSVAASLRYQHVAPIAAERLLRRWTDFTAAALISTYGCCAVSLPTSEIVARYQ